LSKKHAKIKLITSKNFDDWEKVLAEVNRRYMLFRRNLERIKKALLGLPIVSYRRPKIFQKRHASPLFIGIMDLNGKYAIRVIKFYTSIYPELPPTLKLGLSELENVLNDLDSKIPWKMNEVEVKIPEVV